MIYTAEAENIRARLERFKGWIGDRRSYYPSEVPQEARVSNEEISALEVYDWEANPPDKKLVYIKEIAPRHGLATTWMGDTLGKAVLGNPWVSNFGDKRVPVWVRGINGKMYYGTYFKGAGEYARLRRMKREDGWEWLKPL